jgi:hypothetical protein
MNRTVITAALAASVALAGCGGGNSLEGTVRSEYASFAKRRHFAASAQNVESVKCVRLERGDAYDAWCHVRPKGFHLTYDVPVRDNQPLWAKSGVGAAPAS